MQAQQYQAEVARQQQQSASLQPQPQQRRSSFNPPATAGPTGSFEIRTPAINIQPSSRNSLQAATSMDQMPMTARLDGKFGTRSTSMPGTTVISGGTSLGSMASNNAKEVVAPSKSDSASSWRRGASNGNSALNALRQRSSANSLAVKISPPTPTFTKERSPSPPTVIAAPAAVTSKRPKPLSFSLNAQKPMIPEVLIDHSLGEEDGDDASSASGSSASSNQSGKSSPTTSNELLSIGEVNLNQPPLSPRAEAGRKLFEGLGLGRPRSRTSDAGETPPSPPSVSINIEPPRTAGLFPSHSNNVFASGFPQSPFVMAPMPHTASLSGPNYAQHRLDRGVLNQPKRQPRGPPSNTEELGPANFAARSPRLPPSTAGLAGSMQSFVVEAY